nr:MAG TPA: hypothetical protein [Crassvirales sp.]
MIKRKCLESLEPNLMLQHRLSIVTKHYQKS